MSHNRSEHFSPKIRIPDRIIQRWRILITFEHPHCGLQIFYFSHRIGLYARGWAGDIHPKTVVEMKPEAFVVRLWLALGNFQSADVRDVELGRWLDKLNNPVVIVNVNAECEFIKLRLEGRGHCQVISSRIEVRREFPKWPQKNSGSGFDVSVSNYCRWY